MKKSVKVIIKGSVQGVFFRAFVKQEAEKRNIRGYVRNLEDGDVEVWFEGNKKEVDDMLNLCRQGPPHASIREIEVEEQKFQDFKLFKILHI